MAKLRLKDFFALIRVHQWYKNVTIALPVSYALTIFKGETFWVLLVAMLSFCLISSATYIWNDVFDAESDRSNPLKKDRPIASGRVRSSHAIFLALIFLFLGMFLANLVGIMFIFMASLYVILSLFYTLVSKKDILFDSILISILFIVRTLSGVFVGSFDYRGASPVVEISNWLLLCPFFLSLFLALIKKSKNGQGTGSENVVRDTITSVQAIAILSYSLFTLMSWHKNLAITIIPFSYGVIRYRFICEENPRVAENTFLLVKDWKIMLAGILFIALSFSSLLLSSNTS